MVPIQGGEVPDPCTADPQQKESERQDAARYCGKRCSEAADGRYHQSIVLAFRGSADVSHLAQDQCGHLPWINSVPYCTTCSGFRFKRFVWKRRSWRTPHHGSESANYRG